jgi:dTDP-glucose 4,6-dehydratase
MKILVTGGCGFIGCNYLRYILRTRRDAQIVNIDNLTYAGNIDNTRDIETDTRYRFVQGDISDESLVERLMSEKPDAVVNFAAESHVDRSLYAAVRFTKSNMLGAHILLENARKYGVRRFLQVSTDEVYGSLGESGVFTETTPLAPSSPYSASKASADLMAQAYHHTFGMDVVVTRSSNNYGPFQHPEKFVPLFISNAMEGKPCPLYGDGMNVRDWLFVEDNARGIQLALENGKAGEVYNLGGRSERPNLHVAKEILKILGKPESLITFVKDRPGHDRRYALDTAKAERELGFKPSIPFEIGLKSTVEWYKNNAEWLQRIKSSAQFQDHVKKTYS